MENTKKTQDLLMNSIFEVFEKMFFVFLEPIDEEIEYQMISSIKFSGPENGRIEVYFSQSMAEAMVQNMLSVPESAVTETLMEDCAREAVNMIVGNFLQKYDSSKVYDLSIPEFEKRKGIFKPPEKEPGKSAWSFSFESDGNAMGVIMFVA